METPLKTTHFLEFMKIKSWRNWQVTLFALDTRTPGGKTVLAGPFCQSAKNFTGAYVAINILLLWIGMGTYRLKPDKTQ